MEDSHFLGGNYLLIEVSGCLKRNIYWRYQNLIDTITSNNFYLKFKENNENYMAAHIFGLFFITADGRAKLAQQQFSTMLPFHPLYFP